MILTPRHYQQKAHDAFYKSIMETSDKPLVVLPTGTGKALLTAMIVKSALEYDPMAKIAVGTFSQEIVAQNYQELKNIMPSAPAGICSAGLGRTNLSRQVTFFGVQSTFRRASELGKVDLLFVDEAHGIPKTGEGMWHDTINALQDNNPDIRIGGTTATAYRMGTGMLHRGTGALFDDICYEYPILEAIQDGYLCELVTPGTQTKIDISGVRKNSDGEYNQKDLEAAANVDRITKAAVAEIIAHGHGRKKWLVFASGIDHANAISEELRRNGVSAESVTSKDSPAQRRAKLLRHQSGETKALVNMGALTTGYNDKEIDLIANLRDTMSPGLWVQMLGRGTRVIYAEGMPIDTPEQRLLAIQLGPKPNCLVLDFSSNTENHGPIDRIAPKEKRKGGGEAPIKICDNCGQMCFAGVRVCHACGFEFPENGLSISSKASDGALLSSHLAIQWWKVDGAFYSLHGKPHIAPSLQVEYHCGSKSVKEWVNFPHGNGGRWCSARGVEKFSSPQAALENNSSIPTPSAISVIREGKYWKVLSARFD